MLQAVIWCDFYHIFFRGPSRAFIPKWWDCIEIIPNSGTSYQIHIMALEEMLNQLIEAGLKLKQANSLFMQTMNAHWKSCCTGICAKSSNMVTTTAKIFAIKCFYQLTILAVKFYCYFLCMSHLCSHADDRWSDSTLSCFPIWKGYLCCCPCNERYAII